VAFDLKQGVRCGWATILVECLKDTLNGKDEVYAERTNVILLFRAYIVHVRARVRGPAVLSSSCMIMSQSSLGSCITLMGSEKSLALLLTFHIVLV